MRKPGKYGRGRGYRVWLLALLGAALVWAIQRGPEREAEVEAGPVLDWPEFERSPGAVRAARDRAIAAASEELDLILAQAGADATRESTLVAVDRLIHGFARARDRLDLLQHASPDPAVRDAASEAVVALQRWYLDHIALNERLFELLDRFAASVEGEGLTGEDRRLLLELLADARREGLLLGAGERGQLASWRARLTELTTAINRNIHADRGVVEFDAAELDGLSPAQLEQLARDPETGRYRVETALRTQYRLVMRHAARRETRRRTLATELRRALEPNRALIREAIELRTRLARLLGYRSWAALRIEPRMAETPAAARALLLELRAQLDEGYVAEQLRYRDLARAELGDPEFRVEDLEYSDIDYYANMLREREYSIDEEQVREYFAAPGVIARIFAMYEEVLDLEIVVVEDPQHRWAADVDLALVFDAGTGRLRGAIYLDLHPRPGKFTHFATFGLVGGRARGDGRDQAPIAAIVGNWPVAVGARPPLWTLDNVETFLHELGHALHYVLNHTRYFARSAFEVPWDFVEVPSQLLERWLDDPEVLRRLAVDHESGAPMPAALIDRIVAAAQLGAAHDYRRQIGFGSADLAIHEYTDPAEVPDGAELVELANSVFAENYYALPPATALLASFGHLWDGYDAGYYSYAWSDVIAADLARAFRSSKRGFLDRRLGSRLRAELLERGDARPVAESVRALLGRDADPAALVDELRGQNGP